MIIKNLDLPKRDLPKREYITPKSFTQGQPHLLGFKSFANYVDQDSFKSASSFKRSNTDKSVINSNNGYQANVFFPSMANSFNQMNSNLDESKKFLKMSQVRGLTLDLKMEDVNEEDEQSINVTVPSDKQLTPYLISEKNNNNNSNSKSTINQKNDRDSQINKYLSDNGPDLINLPVTNSSEMKVMSVNEIYKRKPSNEKDLEQLTIKEKKNYIKMPSLNFITQNNQLDFITENSESVDNHYPLHPLETLETRKQTEDIFETIKSSNL